MGVGGWKGWLGGMIREEKKGSGRWIRSVGWGESEALIFSQTHIVVAIVKCVCDNTLTPRFKLMINLYQLGQVLASIQQSSIYRIEW